MPWERHFNPARILATAPFEAVRAVSCSPGLEAGELRMRAVRADWEDRRRRKVVRKILPKGESIGRPFAVLGAKRLAVKAPGEFRALALAHVTERLAGRDLAVVQELGGLNAAVLGGSIEELGSGVITARRLCIFHDQSVEIRGCEVAARTRVSRHG